LRNRQFLKGINHASAITRLEDIPNIGKAIASDCARSAFAGPQQLATRDPLKTTWRLARHMGQRHDPCVLYTLIAAKHFMRAAKDFPGGSSPNKGKKLLATFRNDLLKELRDEAAHTEHEIQKAQQKAL